MVTTKDHYLVDIYGCASGLGAIEYWESVIPKLCKSFGLTIVDRLSHHFSPFGATAIYILAESHLVLHTWPEESFATLEIFSCRPLRDHKKILTHFFERMQFSRSVVRVIHRGSDENTSTEESFVYVTQ
jgi:S-adenosylmethionine decarboxylase